MKASSSQASSSTRPARANDGRLLLQACLASPRSSCSSSGQAPVEAVGKGFQQSAKASAGKSLLKESFSFETSKPADAVAHVMAGSSSSSNALQTFLSEVPGVVAVQNLSDSSMYRIPMQAGAKVADLKKALFQTTNIAEAAQTLFAGGKMIDSDETLLSDLSVEGRGDVPSVLLSTGQKAKWLRYLHSPNEFSERRVNNSRLTFANFDDDSVTAHFLMLLRYSDTEMLEVLLNDTNKDSLLHRFLESARQLSETPRHVTRRQRIFSDPIIHRLLMPFETVAEMRDGERRVLPPRSAGLNPDSLFLTPVWRLLEHDSPRSSRLLRKQPEPSLQPSSLWEMPGWLLDDRHFVKAALELKSQFFVRSRPFFIACVRSHLRESRELAKLALQCDAWCVAEFEPELLHDRGLLEVALKKSGNILQYASAECQADKDVVLLAVRESGVALEFATHSVRSDPAVVLEAVRQNGKALQFVSAALRGDRAIVTAALQESAFSLQFAAAKLSADRAIVKVAVEQTGAALQFAAIGLKGDREIVSAAVQQSGKAFQYAAVELRGDRTLAMLAIRQSAWAFDYATPELRTDRSLLKAAICSALDYHQPGCNGKWFDQEAIMDNCFQQLNDVIKNNGSLNIGPILWACLLREQSVAAARVASNPKSYMSLDEDIRSNSIVALEAVKQDWTLFPHVPYQARNEFNVQVAAAKQSQTAYHFMLPTDRKRVMEAVEESRSTRAKR